MSKDSKTQVDVRKPYEKSTRQTIKFSQPTMAKQSFKDECDINTIMKKYQTTGLVSHVNSIVGSYGDYTNVADYQLHLNQVLAANEAFMELPAAIRKRFDNDPAHLLSFLQDEKNRDEAIRLGLIDPPAPEPPPQRVEIVNPPEKKSAGASPQTPASEGKAPA